MKPLQISKKNESELILITDVFLLEKLKAYFSVRVPNAFFTPRFKKTGWNGKISFLKKNILPYGFFFELLKYLKLNNYSYTVDFTYRNKLNEEEINNFISSLDLPFDLYEYQIDNFKKILEYSKISIELPTGAGKTLIIYLLTQYFLNQKILIIVPRIDLLEQMFSDFKKYGFKNQEDYVFCKYTGEDFDENKNIYISTWQSVYKLSEDFFKQFDILIIDEAHNIHGKELQKISKMASNAKYKIGFSGTFGVNKSYEWFNELAGIGPIYRSVDYKKLQELKQIPLFKIKVVLLKYSQKTISEFYQTVGKNFHREQDFINTLPERNTFLVNIAKTFSKNTVFLFTFKEKHGKILYKLMQESNSTKKLFYIDGDVASEERIKTKELIENNNNVIGLASFGVFSEGVSVRNIHNIILASNYKSRIKILQAIGRSLRTHESKQIAIIYDIVDDFQSDIYKNYSLKHFSQRMKIYKEKKINFEIVQTEL